jgi:hypothetical protein
MKSFKAKDGSGNPLGAGRNGEHNFHGEKPPNAASRICSVLGDSVSALVAKGAAAQLRTGPAHVRPGSR